ncbi:MAG: hypothetical protein WCI03_12435 [bacterium]
MKRVTHWLILFILLAAALGIRIASPHFFHLPGNDIPEHIAYPMRLDFADAGRTVFRTTVDRLLSFPHGYTQAGGIYVIYKAFFDWMGVPINPFTLALTHSLIGLASLLSVFAFIRSQCGFRDAILVTAVLAVVPVHVGISAANSGYQLFKLTGIFLSLWRLHEWKQKPCHRTAALYALSLTFALGAGVDFFLTLILNILFMVWKHPENQVSSLRRIFSHPLVFIFAWLPLIAILVWHLYTVSLGFPRGVLARLHSVVQPVTHSRFEPLGVLSNLIILVGPLALLAPVAISIPRVWREGALVKVAAIQWLWEFVVLSVSGRGAWTSHIINLAAPSLILVWMFLKPLRHGLIIFITGGLLSGVLTLLVIFRLGPNEMRTTYGSRSYQETGIEALGYLVRSGILPVVAPPGRSEKNAFVVDFEGAWFFLGVDTLGMDDLMKERERLNEHIVYVQRPDAHSALSQLIDTRVSSRTPTMEILDGSNVLMRIFSSPAIAAPVRMIQSRNYKLRYYSTYFRMRDYQFMFLP